MVLERHDGDPVRHRRERVQIHGVGRRLLGNGRFFPADRRWHGNNSRDDVPLPLWLADLSGARACYAWGAHPLPPQGLMVVGPAPGVFHHARGRLYVLRTLERATLKRIPGREGSSIAELRSDF